MLNVSKQASFNWIATATRIFPTMSPKEMQDFLVHAILTSFSVFFIHTFAEVDRIVWLLTNFLVMFPVRALSKLIFLIGASKHKA